MRKFFTLLLISILSLSSVLVSRPRIAQAGMVFCVRFVAAGNKLVMIIGGGGAYGIPVLAIWQATAFGWQDWMNDNHNSPMTPSTNLIYAIGNSYEDNFVDIPTQNTPLGMVSHAFTGQHPLDGNSDNGCPNVPIPTPYVYLVITKVEVQPVSPLQATSTRIKLTLKNVGTKLLELTSWDFSGSLVLKSVNDDLMTVSPSEFKKGPAKADLISLLPISLQTWVLTIDNVYFWKDGKNATLNIAIDNHNDAVRPVRLTTTKVLTVAPNPDEIPRCLAFLTGAIASVSGPVKALIFDLVSANFSARACHDIGCAAETLIDAVASVQALTSVPVDTTKAFKDVFDPTKGEGECIARLDWVNEIIKRLITTGLPFNIIGVHSPVYPLVTDPLTGQRAGFLQDGTIVAEITDSQVITDGESKYIIYPNRLEVKTELFGTGQGTATLDLLTAAGNNTAQEVVYHNIPVTSKTYAFVDSQDPHLKLKIDTQGGTNFDLIQEPDQITIISAAGEATATPLPTATPTPTPTPTPTASPTPLPSATPTAVPSQTPIMISTATSIADSASTSAVDNWLIILLGAVAVFSLVGAGYFLGARRRR
ncbi:hypothetical protein M1116_02215 [Patescibacteria group bacterium]|nr:hypothetical protein [Patescibacteria group bacterium]